MSMIQLRRRRSAWKGMAAGLAAGLAGTFLMTHFQNAWTRASDAMSKNGNSDSRGKSENAGSEHATEKTASFLVRLAGQELTPGGKKRGSLYVHYAFGTGMGALYGSAMEMAPRKLRRHSALSGAAFGSALFVGADEIAVPQLGLSTKEAPISSHLYGFASHLVYGLSAGLVYRAIRAAL
jgi:putative membrane protein